MDLQALISALTQAIKDAAGIPRGPQIDSVDRSVPVTNVIAPIAGPNPNRTKLIVQNLDAANAIEIGGRALKFGQGIRITGGGSYIDDINPYRGEWFAIASVAGPLDVRVRDET